MSKCPNCGQEYTTAGCGCHTVRTHTPKTRAEAEFPLPPNSFDMQIIKRKLDRIIELLEEDVNQLEAERDCLLRGIEEWDFADAPDNMVQAFLDAASRGEYLAP